MHGEFSISLSRIFGFLLVLARVSGVILFVPVPGMQSVPDAARILLVFALSVVLMPAWPLAIPGDAWLGKLPGWIAAEFTFGLLIGVCVSLLLEGFQMAAQMAGLQAGYSFASTIDPNTQADAGILQIMTQLLASTLFLASGYDRAVIRVLAGSLQQVPSAAALATSSVTEAVVRLGSQIFITGFGLALPVLALLILLDLSFAIVGKVQTQFQLMSLLFPAKMLLGLGVLASSLMGFAKVGQVIANHTLQVLMRLLGN
jgi:flagellar biosynthetic protein FliR